MTNLRPFSGVLTDLMKFYATTPTQLAERSGLSMSMVTKLRAGNRTDPSRATLHKIAKALGCRAVDLF
jgi:transcriptional regulator with XRE-family HTH domain